MKFQSTHPYGCDHHHPAMVSLVDVSIHAPIRVRRASCTSSTRAQKFQSTHPYGCDRKGIGRLLAERGFNPRTHTGATPIHSKDANNPAFQSTHPYGCDDTPTGGSWSTTVSIHAPIRVRQRFNPACQTLRCFNPRTHTGATPAGGSLQWRNMFQSTHPYGCDDVDSAISDLEDSFNPRTHTGATLFPSVLAVVSVVSIHAPIRVRHGC